MKQIEQSELVWRMRILKNESVLQKGIKGRVKHTIILLIVVLVSIFVYSGCGVKKQNANSYYSLNGSSLIIHSECPIGEYDFEGRAPWSNGEIDCDEVASIYVSDGITEIGTGVFIGYQKLTEIRLPEGLRSIGDCAFSSNDKLHEIALPKSIENIGMWAFEGCLELQKILLPDGIQTIGDEAFSRTAIEEIVIPASVIEIGDCAFSDCTTLKKITVLEDNPNYCSIDGVLFNKNKTTLICYPPARDGEEYVIPVGTTRIGASAFWKCNLTKIDIPDTVSIIDDGAFMHSNSLKQIVLPDGLAVISSGLFRSCEGLTKVDVPDTVAQIEPGAFSGCVKLKDINISEDNLYIRNDNGVLYDKQKKTLISYPSASSEQEFVVPESVEEIACSAFSDNEMLERVVLPKKMYKIGYSAFSDLPSLREVKMPEHAWKIEGYLFGGCPKLKEFTVPDGIREIPEHLIWGYDLEIITLPESIKYILSEGLPRSLKTIRYHGSENQWKTINISAENKGIESAEIVYLAS